MKSWAASASRPPTHHETCQLRLRVHPDPDPCIAESPHPAQLGRQLLLLDADVGPDFVTLDELGWNPLDDAVVEGPAGDSDLGEQAKHHALSGAGQTAGGPHAGSFTKRVNDAAPLFKGEPVHGINMRERSRIVKGHFS